MHLVCSVFNYTQDSILVPVVHEFVKVDNQPALQSKSRLSSQDRFLSFTAFGRRYDLRLQLRDNVLLGKNTPVWQVRSNATNSDVEYELLDSVS